MPTARSWTESIRTGQLVDGPVDGLVDGLVESVRDTPRAVRDVGHLLWFRSQATRRRGATRWGVAVLVVLTVAAAVGPAWFGGFETDDSALGVLLVMPTAFAGFLLLSVFSGVASGGGRELIARDQGVAYPVSPTTDHLGALLLTPLNVAWLVQAWMLLGSMSYAMGADDLGGLAGAQAVVVLWILVSTAAAQVLAWVFEAVRRRPGGIVVVRAIGLGAMGVTGWLYFTGRIGAVLDQLPSRELVIGAVAVHDGEWTRWCVTVAALAGLLPVLVALGAVAAHVAARRHPRDELRIESESHSARRMPGSDLLALLRLDRASVWRVVPMRRGIVVLAVGPGLVGIAGNLSWPQMTILPGLVASGGALLFGVNAWCLEGRGMLWRESLPVDPSLVFDARVIVLLEFLLVSSGFTIVLASLRAGVPSAHELAAIVCTWLVVVLQVLSASMRWSASRPFAVDLRSARATPAPPASMVSYSARLALSTTLTSIVFSGLARLPSWELAAVVAIPFLAFSGGRLLMARATWLHPVERVRIVSTVAG